MTTRERVNIRNGCMHSVAVAEKLAEQNERPGDRARWARAAAAWRAAAASPARQDVWEEAARRWEEAELNWN